jgi:hypothetical protein
MYLRIYVSGLMFTLCNTLHRNSMKVDTRFENIKFGSSQCNIRTFHASYGVLYKLLLRYSAVHSHCIDVASHQ